MDENLKNSSLLYQDFIKKLYRAGMVQFTSEPVDLVTPFSVPKKNEKSHSLQAPAADGVGAELECFFRLFGCACILIEMSAHNLA